MKIASVVLNPAFDFHYTVPKFKPYGENYTSGYTFTAAGKGINVSRVLKILGTESTAYAVLGRENSERFEKSLIADNVNYVPRYTDGKIRENITIHTDGKNDTRISLDNFSVSLKTMQGLFAEIACGRGDILLFTGRMPQGLTNRAVTDELVKFKEKGVLVGVDSNSLSKEDIERIRPWIIKPNESEAKSFTDIVADTPENAAKAAEILRNMGAENVIVSLGEKGAVYAFQESVLYASVPGIRSLSAVGAGDSLLAGFVSAFSLGKNAEERLRLASACGTAACLSEGTNPPMLSDIISVADRITVKRLK